MEGSKPSFGGMFGNLKKPCKMCGTPIDDSSRTFCSEKCEKVHAEIKAKKLREQQMIQGQGQQ